MEHQNCNTRRHLTDGMSVNSVGMGITAIFARNVGQRPGRESRNALQTNGQLVLFVRALFWAFSFFSVLLFGRQYLENKKSRGENPRLLFVSP